MRKALLGIAGVSVVLLATTSPGFAGPVNCGIINKDLKMGRTPQDIAERMMISVDDVKKCQEEAAKAGEGAASGAAGEAATKAGEAPAEKPAH